MLLIEAFEFQKRLREKLNQDFIYSLSLDGDKYMLAVSVHRSTEWEYTHGKHAQIALFSSEDLNDNMDTIIDILVNMYQSILVHKNKSNGADSVTN